MAQHAFEKNGGIVQGDIEYDGKVILYVIKGDCNR